MSDTPTTPVDPNTPTNPPTDPNTPTGGEIAVVAPTADDINKIKDIVVKGGDDGKKAGEQLVSAWSDVTQNLLDLQSKIQSADPKDKDAIQSDIDKLQKQKRDLEEFMHANQIDLPSSSLADAFKGVAWAEVYQTTYLILRACDICFEILKYAPQPEDFIESSEPKPTKEEEEQLNKEIAELAKKNAEAAGAPPPTGDGSTPPLEPLEPPKDDKPAVPKTDDVSLVKQTWDGLRRGIVDVLRTSKPQLDDLFMVVNSVTRIGKRFSEFLGFISTVDKYRNAPEYLDHLKAEILTLAGLGDKLKDDTGKYFDTVVGQSSVLLQQAGQEYLKTNADTVIEGENKLKSLETELLAVYVPEIETKNLISIKEGELAGLKLRRDLTKQRVDELNTLLATLTEQINGLRSTEMTNLDNFNSQMDALLKKVTADAETAKNAKQKRLEEAQKAGDDAQAQLDAQIADLQKKLSTIPSTLENKTEVSNSGFWGIGAKKETSVSYQANPEYQMTLDRINKLQTEKNSTRESVAKVALDLANNVNAVDDQWIAEQRKGFDQISKNRDDAKKYVDSIIEDLEKQTKDIASQITDLTGAAPGGLTASATDPSADGGVGVLPALEKNITSTQSALDQLKDTLARMHKTLTEKESGIRASMADWQTRVEAAKKRRDLVLAKYGTVGSDAAVSSTYKLLAQLLELPKTISSNTDHFQHFGQQIKNLIVNVNVGIYDIEKGARAMPPFGPDVTGAYNWLNAITQPGAADKVKEAGFDKPILADAYKSIAAGTNSDWNDVAEALELNAKEKLVIKKRLVDYATDSYDPAYYRPEDRQRTFETGLRNVASELLELGYVVEVITPTLNSITKSQNDPNIKSLTN